MTSLERMSYLVDHDICNSSVPPVWTSVVLASTASKQLAASCLHYVNC